MKTFVTNITISFKWWREEGEVLKCHIEALEESAMDRIIPMMREGFTSGELNADVRVSDEDGDDGINYTGYWNVKTDS